MTDQMREKFLVVLRQTLEAIQEPHFYGTERGYQGELLAAGLRARIDGLFPGNPIVEQEYQKRIAPHGIRIRPDLIVHIPFERGDTKSRRKGNFVAIEIKRDRRRVKGAFENLRKIKEKLDYSLTVLIMVDSDETYAHLCPESIARQTVCFAVRLEHGRAVVHSQKCV